MPHGGIGLDTPADVHYGVAGGTARRRSPDPGGGPAAAPDQVRHHPRPEDPRTTGIGLDQRTPERRSRGLKITPAGLIQLDNFRSPACPAQARGDPRIRWQEGTLLLRAA